MLDLNANAAPLRGVLLLATAVLLFACMDATTKYLAVSYAVPLILGSRYIINLLLLLVFVGPRQGAALVVTRRTGLVILRSLCLVIASLFLGFALQRLPFAETTALIFLAPMLVGVFAGPLLGEKVEILSFAAIIAGFAGVLLIVRPGSGLDPIGVAYMSVVVAASVVYNLLSRVLARTESTAAMLFYIALVGTVCFGAYLPWSFGGPIPSLWQLALFAGVGLAGSLGHFLFTAAFRYAPASTLAPINYLQLVWAGLLGWLVFGHVPDALTIVGMLIVTAAGVLTALVSSRRGSTAAAVEPAEV